MNGRKAKAIRREVYGDQSLRQKRKYVRVVSGRSTGAILNEPGGLRARYLKAKRDSKKSK